MTDEEVYDCIQKYCQEISCFEKEYTWAKRVVFAIRHWEPALTNYQSAAEFISKLKGRRKGNPISVCNRSSFKIYLDNYFPEIKKLNRVMEVE